MNTILKITVAATMTLGLVAGLTAQASAADNDNYGETRWGSLPLKGALSKTPWVGSWWGYRSDGSGYRVHDDTVKDLHYNTYKTTWTRWDSKEIADLSPAEKYDKLMGRFDKIDYDALLEKAQKFQELDSEVSDLIEERRTLIRKLNKAIGENSSDPSFKWQDTEDGKKYLEVSEKLEEQEAIPGEIDVTIDTAFEYEVLKHGTAQFGIESWFGHCNAWAAAAIMEPEPRHPTTVSEIPFTAGDAKAYLTEVYMELNSSFYGSRNNWHEDEESREAIDFQDVTPAAFHILFADLVGNKDKGFVIDRYTGSQVWNQPVRAYRAKAEALYDVAEDGTATPMDREVKYTKYGWDDPSIQERGTQEVYPLLVTTTIHWVTDGLPHEALLDESINDEIDDETFASSWNIGDMWDHQIEIRTLTYELWLDKPMDDPSARIIGDGAWQHGSATDYTELHPDFVWVPLANVNNSRDYENDFYDYDHIVATILPGTLEPHEDPAVVPGSWTASGPTDIPDADPSGGVTVDLTISEDIEIHEMTVDVDVSHTYIGDLQISLLGPDGRSANLKKFGSGGSADDVKKKFNGQSYAGTWQLRVRDQWAQDTGTVNSFTIHIK